MKICLTGSPGGHFTEILKITECIPDHDYFYITYHDETKNNFKNFNKLYFVDYSELSKNGPVKFFNLLCSPLQISKILLKERPDAIISTGGSLITILVCFIGKILGARVIFIEVLARITTPSVSGQVTYPIADLFFVQWESMLDKYGRKAQYRGKIV